MIPISTPDLSGRERAYLLEAFDSGWVSSLGPFIDRAEAALRDVSGCTYASVTSNGTTALHLALLAAGVGAGDEVIIPSLSYVATLNAVLYVGATPVIVDVDSETWCIDPRAVERAVTERTSAILAVDLYGNPADYVELRRIADAAGLILVADAAESIGAALASRPAAQFAHVSTFSFFGNKIVTSGEGGAVVTDDTIVNQRVRQLRNQGNNPSVRYQHDVLGYNYRMTNLSASILTAQLERYDDIRARRREVIDRYVSRLSGLPQFSLQAATPGATAAPWMFTLEVVGAIGADQRAIMEEMSQRGIETRPTFRPQESMPYLSTPHRHETPHAHRISRSGISLPTFPTLGLDSVDVIAQHLVDVVDQRLGKRVKQAD